jgi:hypothetical protein
LAREVTVLIISRFTQGRDLSLQWIAVLMLNASRNPSGSRLCDLTMFGASPVGVL